MKVSPSTRAWMACLLFAIAPAMALAHGLHIVCDDATPAPTCCTAVSDSAGSGASYYWVADTGWGYVDPIETDYNWTHFHCYEGSDGHVEVLLVYADNLEGHGYATCQSG
ncbi:MAG: hypothetical protein HC872_03490 [Gammaproteobacteria bacterium]|nr:hypothetical protein [Gammaproteobacteria bacterium]